MPYDNLAMGRANEEIEHTAAPRENSNAPTLPARSRGGEWWGCRG